MIITRFIHMPGAITTLFEKDYHHGVAALANSLIASGFEGTFWAGYRGEIPPWAKGETLDGGQTRVVLSPKAEMRLMPLDTPLHFAHYKPWFMISVLEQFDPEAEAVFYFDPDITVPTRWSYYEEWVGYGVAMAEDNHYHGGPDHPLRHAWKAFAREKNLVIRRDLSRFVNSGFLGVKRDHRSFLHLWADLVTSVESESGSLNAWRSLDRTYRFWSANQDTLNVAAMITEHPVAIYGPNGMDFVPSSGRPMMSHSVDKPKPWRKQYLRDFLRGKPPSRPDRWFWEYASGPLANFPQGHVKRQQISLRAAAFLARFYHRPDA